MWQVEVSHKSEMASPFNRGDTIINKHFNSYAIADQLTNRVNMVVLPVYE